MKKHISYTDKLQAFKQIYGLLKSEQQNFSCV